MNQIRQTSPDITGFVQSFDQISCSQATLLPHIERGPEPWLPTINLCARCCKMLQAQNLLLKILTSVYSANWKDASAFSSKEYGNSRIHLRIQATAPKTMVHSDTFIIVDTVHGVHESSWSWYINIYIYHLTGLYPLILGVCPGTDSRTFSVHGETLSLLALERFNAIPQSSRFLITQLTLGPVAAQVWF